MQIDLLLNLINLIRKCYKIFGKTDSRVKLQTKFANVVNGIVQV